MMAGRGKPQIRFSSYTDAWEQRKLGELGFAQSGIGFPDVEQGGTEGTPFFKVSDMNTLGNERELVVSNNYVSRSQIARMGWHPITQVPAIFFAKVGAAVMLNRKRLVNTPFLLDNNTMAFSIDRDVLNSGFGQSLFERLDLTSLVQVGALPSYNASDVEEMEVVLPTSMDEQEAIGGIFTSLDSLITLHQRKHEQLSVLKRALLDKMFPRDGADIPEIRFDSFTDPWEQRKLGDVAEITGGLTKNPARKTMPKQLPYLRVANVEAGRINLDELLSIGVTDEEAAKLSLQMDDLLFVEGNGAKSQIGRVAMWKGQVDSCVHQNHLIRARCRQAESSFVTQYYSTPYGRTEIEGKAFTSSGLFSLSVEKIKGLAILVPGENEQRDIGQLLDSIDNLITLHQRKLDMLRRIKSALLDKMFV